MIKITETKILPETGLNVKSWLSNRKAVICSVILSILLIFPNLSIALETSALTSIYKKLNLGQICRDAGFSQCKFILVNSEIENAFATGDGNINIHTALLRNTQTEDELAFIVAHEMGHNVNRHPQSKTKVVGLTTLGNAIAQSIAKNDDTKLLIDAASTAITASYTRSQEEEADIYAIKTTFDAGYNPIMAVNSFRRHLSQQKSANAQWDSEKAKFENALYQSESAVKQKSANVNQAKVTLQQAQQINNSSRSTASYNQYVRSVNVYNAVAADYNNTVNNRKSLADNYKTFMVQYIKAQAPLFIDHPLDEVRISYIISQTNSLKQQSEQTTAHVETETHQSIQRDEARTSGQAVASTAQNKQEAIEYLKRADEYFRAKNYQEAINNFDKAIQLGGGLNMSALYSNRGFAYFLMGNLNKAAEDLQKATIINPSNDRAWYTHGLVCAKLGLEQAAIEDYKTAAKLGNKASRELLTKKGLDW